MGLVVPGTPAATSGAAPSCPGAALPPGAATGTLATTDKCPAVRLIISPPSTPWQPQATPRPHTPHSAHAGLQRQPGSLRPNRRTARDQQGATLPPATGSRGTPQVRRPSAWPVIAREPGGNGAGTDHMCARPGEETGSPGPLREPGGKRYTRSNAPCASRVHMCRCTRPGSAAGCTPVAPSGSPRFIPDELRASRFGTRPAARGDHGAAPVALPFSAGSGTGGRLRPAPGSPVPPYAPARAPVQPGRSPPPANPRREPPRPG